ncbi:hypothetical protein MTO96_052298 [Rhipicephalus appendiculatus]
MATAVEFLVEVRRVTEAVRLSGTCTSIFSVSGTSVGSTEDSGVAMEARNFDVGTTSSNGRRREAGRRCRRPACRQKTASQETASQITAAANGRQRADPQRAQQQLWRWLDS